MAKLLDIFKDNFLKENKYIFKKFKPIKKIGSGTYGNVYSVLRLKDKVYNEDLVNLYDNVYNNLKYKENKIKCKIRSWQNSGKIYDYCWLHIKDKDRENSASAIMILIQIVG